MTLPPADAIFLALSDIEPAERAAFLDKQCGDDVALRREVETLMTALEVPDEDFLDPGRIPTLDMAAADGPLQPGTSLGQFLVLHALGSGGMGVVYAAQQDRPRRTVAIKVLRRGYRHPEILRRFENEAEMLGRLQHPGIAQVYAFFPGDRATPAHLVMELVSGPPITEYVRAQQLSLRHRAALIVRLADAVQHAHERGVIHRDLKPANVLVVEGQPKILDFGIARATGADVQAMTVHTAHGQLMGPLAYMSPEQLRGRPADLDGRSDVYALGVLMYRLLTDRLPFDVANLPWAEAVQLVLESDAVSMGTLNAELAGPLEHVVARAMSRDVRNRYQSAGEFSMDLQRWLAGDSTAASASPRPSVGRSHAVELAPPLAALAADADVICIATPGGLVARSLSSGAELWTVPCGAVRSLTAAGRSLAAGLATGSIELLDAAEGHRIASLDGGRGPITALAFTVDGRHLVSVAAEGVVRFWDAPHARPLTALMRQVDGGASLAPLADGRMVIAAGDGTIEVVAVPADES